MASIAAWSLVHGMATLQLSGRSRADLLSRRVVIFARLRCGPFTNSSAVCHPTNQPLEGELTWFSPPAT